ncbi:hypothetical protein UR09_06430 [Candidatus Nitromaritima sp. SCGC AAA799-A02]|nr:hypothetical protein UR09_06430 [Candidatus Nitromaritima sp. SCGC AAA799-A02]KMP11223.1 hypothetical protein UZ36_05190 [Candidatus Nitromaritima sp. SCGC AAA799-C22]
MYYTRSMDSSPQKPAILSLQYYSFPDAMGGAWKLTHELNKRLVARGRRVVIITCKPDRGFPDRETIDGVEFDRISPAASKDPLRLWLAVRKRVKRYLAEGGPWIAHAHNPLVAALALTVKRYRKVPRVYHFHSSWYDEEKINLTESGGGGLGLAFRLNFIRWMEWACYRSAKSVLFLSEYTRRRFQDYYPFKKPRMRVIPGGVDTDLFKPVTVQGGTDALRQQLDLPQDRIILLTVRRLEARMGLDNLIAAVAEISGRSPELEFILLIAGKGSLAEKLQSQATLLGLDERVRFLGFVSEKQLPEYYAAADIFIMPSASIEGFGIATVEALAVGLPVLGTPVGGTTEILKSIDPVLLFRHATVESMADKIESVLKNPGSFLALKSACREEAVSRYSWELAADLMEEEFGLIWNTR